MSTHETPEHGHAATRAEAVAEHGLGPEGHRAERILRDSPFIIISIVVHALLFVGLTYITTRGSAPRPTVKQLEVEAEVELPEDVPPLRREIETATASAATLGSVGPALNESYSSAAGRTASATIDRPEIMGLRAISGGSSSDLGGDAPDRFVVVPGKSDRTPEGAVDQFAVATLNALEGGRTLVVLLIDQSRSIVYGDLPRVIKRMDRYFDEIDKNLAADLADRGRWVVVSYGRTHQFRGKPSADLEYVKRNLRSVSVDTTGEENIGRTIEAVLDRFSGQEYDNLLIAALTDESGDDIYNPVVLERVIRKMRAAKAQLYVFGYEGSFACRKKRVSFRLDPETVRGPDKALLNAFKGRTVYGFADGGPESPRPELWWCAQWNTWAHWGGGISNIPSGFGMYGLNRLVLASNGIYFLLRPESKYDEDKLYAQYRPDMCSVPKYEARLAKSRLRAELRKTWLRMGSFYVPGDLRNNAHVRDALKRSATGRDFCKAQAINIQRILADAKPESYNWRRWEAHAQLTIAELLRFRFMLGQYHARLLKTWTEHGRTMPGQKRVLMTRGKAPQHYMGPREAKMEHDLALEHIERVINRHGGTPWAVAAARMRGSVYPWQCIVADLPQHVVHPPPLSF